MKRNILAPALGLAALAMVSSSYGQGQIAFQSYNFGATSLNAPVTYGVTANTGGINATAGGKVGKQFTADLLYSFNGGANYTLLTAVNSQDSAYPTPFAFGLGNDNDSANFAGYFFGNTATIPGYTSGAVTFIIEAFNGTSYGGGDTTWNGQSAPFTMSSIAFSGVGAQPAPPSDFSGLTGFVVNPVPEPSIFALAGLGAAGLMAFRRKK